MRISCSDGFKDLRSRGIACAVCAKDRTARLLEARAHFACAKALRDLGEPRSAWLPEYTYGIGVLDDLLGKDRNYGEARQVRNDAEQWFNSK